MQECVCAWHMRERESKTQMDRDRHVSGDFEACQSDSKTPSGHKEQVAQVLIFTSL